MTYGIPDIGETGSIMNLYADRDDTDSRLIRALCYHLNDERQGGKYLERRIEQLEGAIRKAGYKMVEKRIESPPASRVHFVLELEPIEEMGG